MLQNILQQIGNNKTCPVAVIIQNSKVLMGKRHYSENEVFWTCPGGRCNSGETIEIALRREVGEEIGITDFEILKYITELDGYLEGDKVFLFLCQTKQIPRLMEPANFSEWRWFGLGEVPQDFITQPARKIIIDLLKNELPSRRRATGYS